MSFPWLFPRGIGCFFDDRPFGAGFTFAKWMGRLVFYYDERFAQMSHSLSSR